MNNKIVVLCGFSASGKDSLCKYISDNYNYEMVKSTTSRPMRPNESECNPYHFVSKQEFETMIANGEFIECRKYRTLVSGIPDIWYYGVHKGSIDLSKHNYIVVLDILGLREFITHFGEESIVAFFIDVPETERRRRAMESRADFDLTEWNRRYKDDIQQFAEDVIEQEVTHVVKNDDFNTCINTIIKYLDGGN